MFLLVFSIFLLAACNFKTEPDQPMKYPDELPALAYKFDYTPEKSISSIKETIAIVSPQFKASPTDPEEKNNELTTINDR